MAPMTTATAYYKAVRPDGRSFHEPFIDYAAALDTGEVIRHPAKRLRNRAETYLSVSVKPADCTGFSWPCRLFRVEPVGRVMANLSASPNKRALTALRVVEELPAHMALGPNGEQVAAFIERCRTMTPEQARKLDAAGAAARAAARAAAWDAAWDAAGAAAWAAAGAAARAAARAAAWDAAWDAAGAAAWAAARAAAGAILVRDKITAAQYATLTQPFVDVGLGDWVA